MAKKKTNKKQTKAKKSNEVSKAEILKYALGLAKPMLQALANEDREPRKMEPRNIKCPHCGSSIPVIEVQ